MSGKRRFHREHSTNRLIAGRHVAMRCLPSLVAALFAICVLTPAHAVSPDAPSNILTVQERADGWRLLFDGKTLNGWRNFRQNGTGPEWEIANGAIVLQRNTKPGDAGNLAPGIMTEETFGDFELTVDWKISAGANSGILYRVTEETKNSYESGIEMQVLDNQVHPDAKKNPNRQAGACYALYAPAKDVTHPVGEWNTARILVRANHVEHWLNGVQLLSFELGSPDWQERVAASKFKDMPAFARAKEGHLLLQDHGFHCEFRNIKIRTFAATK